MPFDNTIRKARGKSTDREQGCRNEKYLTHGKTRGSPATLTYEAQGGLNVAMAACRAFAHGQRSVTATMTIESIGRAALPAGLPAP